MTVITFGGDTSDLLKPVTHYVTKAGNDTTGDGSLALPWLTIHKALTTAPAGAVIGVGTGVYQEDSGSGYLNVSRQFTSKTYLRSLTGFAGDVVIQGTSDATYNTLISANASNIRFRNVTFTMRISTNSHCVRVANCSNIEFYTCVFHVRSDASYRAGLQVQPSGVASCTGLVVSGCSFTQRSLNSAGGIVASGWAAGATATGTIENCSMRMYGECILLNGGTWTMRGGTYHSTTSHAVVFGSDSISSGFPTVANVNDVVIQCVSGHAFLFGNGCTNCSLTNSLIIGGDYGIVLKESSGHSVRGCTIYGGSTAAVYYKAVSGCTISGCTIHAFLSGAYAVRYNQGDTPNFNKCSGCALSANTIHVGENAFVYNFCPNGFAADDTGGTTVFNNNDVLLVTPQVGPYGTIGATVGIATEAALLTAWSGYGGGTNDNATDFGGQAYA